MKKLKGNWHEIFHFVLFIKQLLREKKNAWETFDFFFSSHVCVVIPIFHSFSSVFALDKDFLKNELQVITGSKSTKLSILWLINPWKSIACSYKFEFVKWLPIQTTPQCIHQWEVETPQSRFLTRQCIWYQQEFLKQILVNSFAVSSPGSHYLDARGSHLQEQTSTYCITIHIFAWSFCFLGVERYIYRLPSFLW